jgi:hypothetical protein
VAHARFAPASEPRVVLPTVTNGRPIVRTSQAISKERNMCLIDLTASMVQEDRVRALQGCRAYVREFPVRPCARENNCVLRGSAAWRENAHSSRLQPRAHCRGLDYEWTAPHVALIAPNLARKLWVPMFVAFAQHNPGLCPILLRADCCLPADQIGFVHRHPTTYLDIKI